MKIPNTLRREFRVALSRKAQPAWFRIVKWSLLIAVIWKFRNTPNLAWILSGLLVVALGVHFFYRWKTRGWRQPWGGWTDVDAGRP